MADVVTSTSKHALLTLLVQLKVLKHYSVNYYWDPTHSESATSTVFGPCYNRDMEYTKFNKNGQWELCKAMPEVAPLAAKPKVDKPYKVFGGSTLNGELHEDYGAKGSLHNFGAGTRPKNAYNKRKAGKPFHPEHSVISERNPGLGNEEVE